jgi:hypothetical protein
VSAAAAGLVFAFLQPSLARADAAPPAPVPGLPDAFPTVPAAPRAAPPAASTSDVPPVPDASDPESVPMSPDGLGEQIAATVQEAAGSVDVSVRVLSPGSDGSVTQNPPSNVIPDMETGDITAPSQTDATPASAPDTSAAEPDESSPSTSEGGGNITVRVLSPGDNGPVTQTNDQSSDSAAPSPPSAPEDTAFDNAAAPAEVSLGPTSAAGDSTDEPALSDENSTRYQEADSQYQSEDTSQAEPWYWSWQLVIDCAGDVTTVSNETGSSSSADWTWDWMWDWSCDRPHDPAGSAGSDGPVAAPTTDSPSAPTSPDTRATNANVSVRVLSPGDDGPVTQTGGAPTSDGDGSSEPTTSMWTWSWTFTFCGRTITVSSGIAAQGDLSWLWSWVWNWPCDSAVGPPPDLRGGAPESSADMPPQPGAGDAGATAHEPPAAIPPAPAALSTSEAPDTTSDPASSVPTFSIPVFSIPAVNVTVALAWPTTLTGQLELSPPTFERGLDVAGVTISIGAGVTGSISSAPVAGEATPAAVVAPSPLAPHSPAPATVPRSTVATPPAARTASFVPRTQVRDARKPPKEPVSVRPAPRRHDRGAAPFPLGELQSGQMGDAGTFGGRVASTQVVGSAATLAFFRLAAPGLGRRIRVARGLSPRSAYRTSIDHPG